MKKKYSDYNYNVDLTRDMTRVTLSDIMVLMYHMRKGALDKDVGWEHASREIHEVMRFLDKQLHIPTATLEGALWSANLLDEQGKFVHPEYKSFEEWSKGLLKKGEIFNRTFNVMERK